MACDDYNSTICSLATSYSCNSNVHINDVPIRSFCCKACSKYSFFDLNPSKPTTAAPSTNTPSPTKCIDYDPQICSVVTSYSCSTNTLINKIPVSSFCCLKCSNTIKLIDLLEPSASSLSPTQSCIDYNENICKIISEYTCKTFTYINNIPIGNFCCAGCAKHKLKFPNQETTQLFHLSKPPLLLKSKITSDKCIDYNSVICPALSELSCNSYTYISQQTNESCST